MRLGQTTEYSGLLPDDELSIPLRSEELIQRLNNAYPPRCKTLSETEEQHQRYAGVRDLIDELMTMWDEQNDGS